MIYTDGIHLIGDSVEELHRFALSIGLKPEWFQDKPDRPYYDLLGRDRLDRALRLGAQMVPDKVIVQILRYQVVLQAAQAGECELDGWASRFPDSSEPTREVQSQILDAIQPIRPDPYRIKVKKS